jgi:RNA-splicing ligase RtcB
MNGKDLIDMGYEPGPHFPQMLALGNSLEEHEIPLNQIREALDEIYLEAMEEAVKIPLKESGTFTSFIDPGRNEFEEKNVESVMATMEEVVKTPTVVDAWIMPDACPAGSIGTIPVGGVVAAKNAIHPGMHSADICCSMFLTSIDEDIPVDKVLDAVQKRSHFGVGGRKDISMGHGHAIIERAKENRFLGNVQMFKAMSDHLGTQGDGNHFFFVGRKESNGQLTFVTHHGSRKPGALLYKQGMKIAEQFRKELSPDTLKQNAWIPYDTMEGQEYWEALQIIREWTKYNHTVIHDAVMMEFGLNFRDITDRFWNEHNFVFKADDIFYHAKGSTPVWGRHAHDADIMGRTIIPLNMGEPILITENHPGNDVGFAPHGAGRNMSRTQFMKNNAGKTVEQIMKEEVGHIDARFYSGKPDASELPGAYKDAKEVQRQIEDYKLAKIVDRIQPLGSMMAGELEKPWLKRK